MLAYGVYSKEGVHHPNEDRYRFVENLVPKSTCKPVVYGAVYDGHGGSYCSKFVKKRLHKNFMALLDGNKLSGSDEEADAHIREVIHEAFLKTEEEYLRISEELGEFSGSCVNVVLAFKNQLYSANLGDSRAVVLKHDAKTHTVKATALSRDHKASLEKHRIQMAGGFVENGRVNGVLAVSRTIGDREFKDPMLFNRGADTDPVPRRKASFVESNSSAATASASMPSQKQRKKKQPKDSSKPGKLAASGDMDMMSEDENPPNEEQSSAIPPLIGETPRRKSDSEIQTRKKIPIKRGPKADITTEDKDKDKNDATTNSSPPTNNNNNNNSGKQETPSSASAAVQPAETSPKSHFGDALTRLKQRFFPKRSEDPLLRVKNTSTIVSAEPEVRVHTRVTGEDYVLVASDGLWDTISTSSIGLLVHRYFKKFGTEDLTQVCRLLAEEAASRGSQDDITVLIFRLKPLSEN